MRNSLPESYYLSEDVLALGQNLLGKRLMTDIDGVVCGGIIVETEAYRAPLDQASHARNYTRTARTEVMYYSGGHSYVYICYGIHILFNVITGPEEMPHAVLIRAIEPSINPEIFLKRRGKSDINRISAGPGLLSACLGISKRQNGVKLYDGQSNVWIEDVGLNLSTEQVVKTTRVGIESSGEWAGRPWRFYVKNSQFVSKK